MTQSEGGHQGLAHGINEHLRSLFYEHKMYDWRNKQKDFLWFFFGLYQVRDVEVLPVIRNRALRALVVACSNDQQEYDQPVKYKRYLIEVAVEGRHKDYVFELQRSDLHYEEALLLYATPGIEEPYEAMVQTLPLWKEHYALCRFSDLRVFRKNLLTYSDLPEW